MTKPQSTNQTGVEIEKIALGEKVEFEDIALVPVTTQFGESTIVNFADKSGNVIRKCYAQGGMIEFINKNPEAKSIMLKKKLRDGEYTYNVWSQ